MNTESSNKAYIISVNMGYGHERAAYALHDIAHSKTIIANNYKGIAAEEKKQWDDTRRLYEAVSRLQPIPIVGDIAFAIMDKIQEIPSFYPRRDLSAPNLQLRETYRFIKKHKIMQALIDRLSEDKRHLPIVSTFFIPAFAAEMYDYPGDIYCVICDADFSRTWVPMDAKRSRIKYFAPCGRVVERLKLYGVREENIYLTGFPIPKELIGGPDSPTLKQDILERFCNLDPKGTFRARYAKVLRERLGADAIAACKTIGRPLTLTFSVGGAGAQRHLGVQIVESLREKIKRHQIRINLMAGTRKELAAYFHKELKKIGISPDHGDGVNIAVWRNREEYFKAFAELLRKTDILWTKPSELSFYTGAGLPIIMAPTIGSQEKFNRLWLEQIGGGIDQLDPSHTDEWLFDWVESGALARMAWTGYIEAPTHGTYRIEEIITGKKVHLEEQPPMVV